MKASPLPFVKRRLSRQTVILILALALPALFLGLFRLLRDNRALMNWLILYVTTPIKRGISWLCDLVPFSVSEVIWSCAVLALLLFLLRTLWLLIRRGDRLRRLLRRCAALLSAGLIIYSGYTFMWGINYYGDSFADQSGLVERGATAEELYILAASFAQEASNLSGQIPRDEEGRFQVDTQEIFSRSQGGLYEGIVAEFPFLAGPERRPKPMLMSRMFSYMGFTGFLFPFTGEANLNIDPPNCLLPAIIAHELAHQRNVAAEQEANFVGILACLRSGDVIYQYSGALMGYIYLSNALYSASYDLWQSAYGYLNEEALADLQANNEYWAQFSSPAAEAVEKASDAVYEQFLKSYGQELGMRSYGACVDLLVAYYFDNRPL